MKNPAEQTVKKIRCPICQKEFEATVMNFFKCEDRCGRWICKNGNCLAKCETCGIKLVCLDCARRNREEFYTPSVNVRRCRECQKFCATFFVQN